MAMRNPHQVKKLNLPCSEFKKQPRGQPPPWPACWGSPDDPFLRAREQLGPGRVVGFKLLREQGGYSLASSWLPWPCLWMGSQ